MGNLALECFPKGKTLAITAGELGIPRTPRLPQPGPPGRGGLVVTVFPYGEDAPQGRGNREHLDTLE